MKVLWVSNHPRSPSGYGSQTRQVGRRIAAAGYDLEFSANDGSRGSSEYEGLHVRGSGADRYSRDKVREDFERSAADWAIILYDPWVYTERMADPFTGNRRIAGWVPVDHNPVPPSMYSWLSQHVAIAMSRYGEAELKALSAAMRREGGEGFDVRYAPHAIEPVFKPMPSVRADLGVPDDAFLVGIVAANNGSEIYDRKGFGDMFLAVTDLMAKHPDAYLYVHSLQFGYQGINLPTLAQAVGMDPARLRWADQYRYKDQGYSDADMAGLYSSFDVLLSTSRGEGFGIPVIEAQACGTPVIVSNWTAQPELVGDPWRHDKPDSTRHPSGWIVSAQPDYDAHHAAFFAKPNISFIIRALGEAYVERGTMREAAIAKASEYAADAVFEKYWVPILQEMDALTRAPNRKERRAMAASRR